MATPAPPPSPVLALTETQRTASAKQAAITAALVVYYYRTRVNVEDSSSIDRWLSLVVPRILADRAANSRLSAFYGDSVRRLELPGVSDGFRFDPTVGTALDPAVVRSSLMAVGPNDVLAKVNKATTAADPKGPDKAALIAQANQTAQTKLTGATMRHVQNGGRAVLLDGTRRDARTLGYVRTTRGDCCYFCAMLASRGLVGGAYQHDSFDESNARFADGKYESTIKVHDHCSCSLKPVYTREDPVLDESKKFFELWQEAEHVGGSGAQIKKFRQLYEGRAS